MVTLCFLQERDPGIEHPAPLLPSCGAPHHLPCPLCNRKGQCSAHHICTHTHIHGALSQARSRVCPHTIQTLCMGSGNTVSLHSWHTTHTHVCLRTSTRPSTPATSHTNIVTNAFETHIHVYVYIMMVSYLATSAPKTVKNSKAKQGPCQGTQIDVTMYAQRSEALTIYS